MDQSLEDQTIRKPAWITDRCFNVLCSMMVNISFQAIKPFNGA